MKQLIASLVILKMGFIFANPHYTDFRAVKLIKPTAECKRIVKSFSVDQLRGDEVAWLRGDEVAWLVHKEDLIDLKADLKDSNCRIRVFPLVKLVN